MNRYVRRVFDSYALLLLVAVAFSPRHGKAWTGQLAASGPIYAWRWAPPCPPGWCFEADYPRLLLEILPLALVLVLAVVNLWEPTGGAGPYQGSSRPS